MQRSRTTASRNWIWPAAAITVFGALLVATIYLTSRPTFTDLDNGLLQFFFFAVGTGASFFFGRRSTEAAAQALLKRDGRKAVRRLLNLVAGIQDLSVGAQRLEAVVQDVNAPLPPNFVTLTFEGFNSQIEGQLRTVADTIEDWRDIVPEEVERIERASAN